MAAAGVLALSLLSASPAYAFTPRVHMAIANEVRQALIESGDGSIQLRWSQATVRIPQDDADAIVAYPLAFRAGVTGPDSIVAPGLTDGTHHFHTDPTPPELAGQRETYTFELLESPRRLRITDSEGRGEDYLEGAVAAPMRGLTAELRVFANDSTEGSISHVACEDNFLSDDERRTLWGFARRVSGSDALVASEVVAASELGELADSEAGPFSVTDIDGFSELGGTELSDQFNFMIRFTGQIEHGGEMWVREANDDPDGSGLWIFADEGVSSMRPDDLLLEVQHYVSRDATDDVTSLSSVADHSEIEILVVWCPFSGDRDPLTPEVSLSSPESGFGPFSAVVTRPNLDPTLFPPVL